MGEVLWRGRIKREGVYIYIYIYIYIYTVRASSKVFPFPRRVPFDLSFLRSWASKGTVPILVLVRGALAVRMHIGRRLARVPFQS